MRCIDTVSAYHMSNPRKKKPTSFDAGYSYLLLTTLVAISAFWVFSFKQLKDIVTTEPLYFLGHVVFMFIAVGSVADCITSYAGTRVSVPASFRYRFRDANGTNTFEF